MKWEFLALTMKGLWYFHHKHVK